MFKPRAEKNYFRFFDIFDYLFFNRLHIISSSGKNMDRLRIVSPLRNASSYHRYPNEVKKNYFRYFSLFFLTDLILSDLATKIWIDRELYVLSKNKLLPISKHRTENIIFGFAIFFFIFLNRLYII